MTDKILERVNGCIVQRQLLEIVCIIVNCAKVKNVTSLSRTQMYFCDQFLAHNVLFMWKW